MTLPIIITTGEPAGIGPDILLQLANQHDVSNWTVVADKDLLQQRATMLNLSIPDALKIVHMPLVASSTCGTANPANAEYVLNCLRHAVQGCLTQTYSAMVTGPVHKAIINDGGFSFSGQTEYLAKLTHSELAVMLLVYESVRIGLVTTHLPLRDVASHITAKRLTQTLHILHHELIHKFGIENPRIHVCGLNPHAGENGHLGKEEIDTISPVIEHFQGQGLNFHGPLSADTAFVRNTLFQADATVAMFHDQGLPVIKHMGFGNAVNTTLGLPIIRTSVDHGAALALAGSGNTDPGSLLSAIKLALFQGSLQTCTSRESDSVSTS